MAQRVTRQQKRAGETTAVHHPLEAPGAVAADVAQASQQPLEPTLSASFVVQSEPSVMTDDATSGGLPSGLPSGLVGVIATPGSIEDQLANHITNLKNQLRLAQKRLKSLSTERIIKEAMRVYYHEHKGDVSIINDVRTRLRASGLLVETGNGKKDVIHWSNIKMATDANFNLLSDDQKNAYYVRAQATLAQKTRTLA